MKNKMELYLKQCKQLKINRSIKYIDEIECKHFRIIESRFFLINCGKKERGGKKVKCERKLCFVPYIIDPDRVNCLDQCNFSFTVITIEGRGMNVWCWFQSQYVFRLLKCLVYVHRGYR